MKNEKFIVRVYNNEGMMIDVYSAPTLEAAEYFAIARIKTSIAKQTPISEAAVWGYSQGKTIMYSIFKKEENS